MHSSLHVRIPNSSCSPVNLPPSPDVYFGRTMRMFAPLYLSNECINSCAYCGFSRENAILRVTLEIEEVAAEALYILGQGFRNILLVAGEHPKFVSGDYLKRCIRRLSSMVPSLSLEVAPMEFADMFRLFMRAPKDWSFTRKPITGRHMRKCILPDPRRTSTGDSTAPNARTKQVFGALESARSSGFGIGGRKPWPWPHMLNTFCVNCWKAQITVSLPRLRPAAGDFHPTHPLPDREFIQVLCALRVTFPQIGIVLSTRESEALRDAVAPLGVTMMSAGSHTEPGGYTARENKTSTIQRAGAKSPPLEISPRVNLRFQTTDHPTWLPPVCANWDSSLFGRIGTPPSSMRPKRDHICRRPRSHENRPKRPKRIRYF